MLRAALDEFVHIGYHGATVRGIAARAGLSVPGIYHYYGSKQHMLMSIMEYAMCDLLRRARAAQADGRDPVERFSLQVEHLVLFHTHRAELGFVGAAEKRSLAPRIRAGSPHCARCNNGSSTARSTTPSASGDSARITRTSAPGPS